MTRASGAVLDETGLNAVVDVSRNVVTELDGGGIAVDALVVSVVTAAGPLALVTVGHAEVRGATCDLPDETHAPAETLPRTGGSLDAGLWMATALGALAVAAHRLRRLVVAG